MCLKRSCYRKCRVTYSSKAQGNRISTSHFPEKNFWKPLLLVSCIYDKPATYTVLLNTWKRDFCVISEEITVSNYINWKKNINQFIVVNYFIWKMLKEFSFVEEWWFKQLCITLITLACLQFKSNRRPLFDIVSQIQFYREQAPLDQLREYTYSRKWGSSTCSPPHSRQTLKSFWIFNCPDVVVKVCNSSTDKAGRLVTGLLQVWGQFRLQAKESFCLFV